MSEPRRLKDDPDAPAELRALFTSAPKPGPMGRARKERMRQRVAVIAATPVAFSILSLLWKAGAVATAVGVVIVGGAVIVRQVMPAEPTPVGASSQRSQAVEEAPVAEAPVAEAPAAEPPAVEAEPAEPTEPVERPEAASGVSARERREPPRATPTQPTEPAAAGLSEEADIVRRAHGLLATEPARALALAGEHQRRFPEGALRSERELVAVRALSELGRTDAARARAERLLARDPGGLASARAREILAELPR